MSQDTLIQIAMMILAAAATYGAIRQDIRNIHEKIAQNVKDIDKAHERIDDLLMGKVHVRNDR